MPLPSLSIITPVYNTGHLLLDTVESVLKQEPLENMPIPNYEFLIIDDDSDDPETISILSNLHNLDPRIRVVRNHRKKGVSGARNTGLDLANGDWIAFLDSDDLWLPHALAYRWHYISHNQEAKWIAAPFLLIRNDQIEYTPLSQRSPQLYDVIKDSYNKNRVTVLKSPVYQFAKDCLLQTGTVMVKKENLMSISGFNENLMRAEDYELWFKLAATEDLHFLPEDTSIYRLRQNSLTRTSTEPRYFHEDVMIKGLIANQVFLPYKAILKKRLHFVLLDNCYFYRIQGSYYQSLRSSVEFLSEFPFSVKSWKMLIASLLAI